MATTMLWKPVKNTPMVQCVKTHTNILGRRFKRGYRVSFSSKKLRDMWLSA